MLRIASLSSFLLAVVAGATAAQDFRPPVFSAEDFERHRRAMVAYDAREDGTLWAVGADYKVGFDARGAEYRPRFGQRQETDLAWQLTPSSVRVDGEPLAFTDAVLPERDGDRVAFARGAFVERYDLSPGAVEQSFVFTTLPARGALEFEIPAGPGWSEADGGLAYESPLGRVTWSRTVAIDARGARTDAETTYVDGTIRIRIDATFVHGADLPLIVDPTLTTIPIASTADALASDCLFDPVANTWFVVYQQPFSGTDYDLIGYTFDTSGAVYGAAQIEGSTSSWLNPRCAAVPTSQRILVVAEVTNVVPKVAVARLVSNQGGLIQALPTVLNVAGTTSGDVTAPDVGGDPYPGSPAYFCVVFNDQINALEREVGYRLISPSGTLVGTGPTFLAHVAGTSDAGPSISSSNATIAWTIAWQRSTNAVPVTAGIWGAQVNWSGLLLSGPFLVADSALFERAPSVSSPLTGTTRVLVAYRQSSSSSSQGDIGLTALDGATVLASVNLTTLENAGTSAQNQQNPNVDCDGADFFVAYPETSAATNQFDLFGCEVRLVGNEITAQRPHVLLRDAAGPVQRPRVAGKQGTSPTNTWFVGYDVENSATDHDVEAALYQGAIPGSAETFCHGDGTGSSCPCGNVGAATHGCAHSASAIGAWLLKTGGQASVALDTCQIAVGNVPTNAPCVFIQGNTELAGNPFGDGLLCVGSPVTRLGVVAASGTQADGPLGLAVAGGLPPSGGKRVYQAWYRDSSLSFCSGSTFNLSNGLAIYWAP